MSGELFTKNTLPAFNADTGVDEGVSVQYHAHPPRNAAEYLARVKEEAARLPSIFHAPGQKIVQDTSNSCSSRTSVSISDEVSMACNFISAWKGVSIEPMSNVPDLPPASWHSFFDENSPLASTILRLEQIGMSSRAFTELTQLIKGTEYLNSVCGMGFCAFSFDR